jgi:uncharacterized glyoxalase superfamily protein PhnB
MTDMKQFPNSVMLTCNDVKASVDFYTKVLGFELETSWPDENKPMWANLVLDKQSIMVGSVGDENDAMDCGSGDFPADQMELWKSRTKAFRSGTPGAGIMFYVMVEDVDRYYATIQDRGAKPLTAPHTQFYGIRDFAVPDPDGYLLVPYTTVKMETCQSCGMPLTEAVAGEMFCKYCTDDKGQLRPYEAVLEGSIQGYFMGMQKMERPEAEVAAKEHLSKMPAWVGR